MRTSKFDLDPPKFSAKVKKNALSEVFSALRRKSFGMYGRNKGTPEDEAEIRRIGGLRGRVGRPPHPTRFGDDQGNRRAYEEGHRRGSAEVVTEGNTRARAADQE